jgi:hypothetical protein
VRQSDEDTFSEECMNLFSAGTRVSRQSNPTVSVTMEAETQTEEEQVNIIDPSDPITPMYIGNFASGTDSLLAP